MRAEGPLFRYNGRILRHSSNPGAFRRGEGDGKNRKETEYGSLCVGVSIPQGGLELRPVRGGSHEEVCGAISGGALILSLCFPHAQGGDQEAKRNLYRVTKEYRRRFFEVFGYSRCGDLLQARPGVTEKTPAAQRLGVASHCDNMIVTAVELLEALVREEQEGPGEEAAR